MNKTPKQISEMLAGQAESLCQKLLPHGVRDGVEWCVGSIAGEAGKSLKVRLTGNKAGVWADFADGNKSGDLLDLICSAHSCKLPEALKWAKQFLGVRDDSPHFTTPLRVAPRPLTVYSATTISAAVVDWFKARGISEATLKLYKVTASGNVANLPCYIGTDIMYCKKADVSRPKKERFSCVPGGTNVLFGWQSLDGNEREIVITEGECDAMAYREQGVKALSIPMGAGVGANQSWIENDWERLEPFDIIYLSMDMDDAGKAVTEHIANRIGLHRCRVIKLPLKDANDALLSGHKLDVYVDKAVHLDPAELKTPEDFFQDVFDAFYPKDSRAAGNSLPWDKAANQFRLRPAETTVWCGINGHGKSMVLSHVTTHLMNKGERVCVASMEMPPGAQLKRLYQQASGIELPDEPHLMRLMDWANGHIWIINIRGTAKTSRLLEVGRYAWQRYNIGHLIIDSMAKCGMNEDDYNGQKRFVEELTDLSAATRMHVHLVTHARKGEDEGAAPGKMDIKGTGAISDMVDNVVSVWRNKRKEDAMQKAQLAGTICDSQSLNSPDAMMHVLKQRNFDWEGKIALWFDPASHQYKGKPEDGVMRYVI